MPLIFDNGQCSFFCSYLMEDLFTSLLRTDAFIVPLKPVRVHSFNDCDYMIVYDFVVVRCSMHS